MKHQTENRNQAWCKPHCTASMMHNGISEVPLVFSSITSFTQVVLRPQSQFCWVVGTAVVLEQRCGSNQNGNPDAGVGWALNSPSSHSRATLTRTMFQCQQCCKCWGIRGRGVGLDLIAQAHTAAQHSLAQCSNANHVADAGGSEAGMGLDTRSPGHSCP